MTYEEAHARFAKAFHRDPERAKSKFMVLSMAKDHEEARIICDFTFGLTPHWGENIGHYLRRVVAGEKGNERMKPFHATHTQVVLTVMAKLEEVEVGLDASQAQPVPKSRRTA